MNIQHIYQNYFNGFQEIGKYDQNSIRVNCLAILKIFSYFTIVLPVVFGTIQLCASLYNRVYCQTSPLSEIDEKTKNIAENQVAQPANPTTSKEPTQPLDPPAVIYVIETVEQFSGELSLEEKQNINFEETKNGSETNFVISFKHNPNFRVTIQEGDITESQAPAIINAANTHLGGGGGIDRSIHKAGGDAYRQAHQGELRGSYYKNGDETNNYREGYAALITSGNLKIKGTERVIVVAGPSCNLGTTDHQVSVEKQNQLYSCYYNSLVLADKYNLSSVASGSISTGVFNFPRKLATQIFLKAMYDFSQRFPSSKVKEFRLCLYGIAQQKRNSLFQIYREALLFTTQISSV